MWWSWNAVKCSGGYENPVKYEFVSFKAMKPAMMQEAIENAELTATQFAKNSNSRLDKIKELLLNACYGDDG